MSSRDTRIDTGVGVSFIASAVIHLAVFLLLVWWGRLFSSPLAIHETYYVDVVNLPVAAPKSGSSAQKPGESETAPAPVPSPSKVVPINRIKPTAPQESAETESAFAERMAKLEGKAEARHYEEKMKKLGSRKSAASNTKVGNPTTGGTDIGSSYADFIKSRLEDALKVTSYYTTKKPEVSVRLTIAADGRLLKMKVERTSGDAAFELSVRRAIELASEKFTAPPNRTVFENGFVFKPKGISNDTSR